MSTNPDLENERTNAKFSVDKMAAFIRGGEQVIERRRYLANLIESTPEFKDPVNPIFMTREERYENAMRKTVAMAQHADKLDLTNIGELFYYQKVVLCGDSPPLYLHFVMFLPTLRAQCNDEQLEKWLPLAYSQTLNGTYAQTELGHGTNLKKLETTATYDPKSQEFVIHTPTLTATKWWPGNLGKAANYAIVTAQLYTKGVCYGMHTFLVQLRDLITHKVLPGIEVGDIGPKFGHNTNDNGYLRFDHVRIPRDQMLMRFASVDPDGTYNPPKHSKSVYGSMIYVRSIMIMEQASALGAAVTIATRYSCVRRQGEQFEGRGEVKILDYQSQQYRLFPELAKALAYLFGGFQLWKVYDHVTSQLRSGDTQLLPELHSLSAGMKAYITYEVAKGIEICRLACGGHGYSLASGLPELYGNIVAGCTYEGDNIVLLLQVARHLLKIVKQKKDNKLCSYLWKKYPPKSRLDSKLNREDLLEIYQYGAQRKIFETMQELEQIEKSTNSFERAWSNCLIRLSKCAKAHVRVFLVENFAEYIEKCEDQNSREVLKKMCKFYTLYGIYTKPGAFLEYGFLDSRHLQMIRNEFHRLLAEIRPMAVQLTDAFDFHDRELMSCLGRYDGRVYESLFEWAKQSPLNKQEVLDCHYKYMAPKILEAKSKL